ncbi:hypothetical protein ACFSTH_00145 [Paenibacillus yanchengensis]|uniref:Uncharacterized protein n=1 Tax=Paenibacillus yanchengensis TaxID=2035833 RepID=A0ABW4YEQ4_9BACL
MNRSRYIPFERNRYFYGKLLTVRDFMSEQTYFADKRRLSNRLLFGTGVITGLQVVAVDDKSISVEAGAALDQLGREIIVPSPITIKLSNVDGFTNNEYAKNVYLCLGYDELGKEPVHTVAGALGTGEEVSEHNRILESYKLFVRESPPAPNMLEYDALMEETSVWYDDGQVRILQTIPKYVEPGQTFTLGLTVEKTLQTPHISFEYVPQLTNGQFVDEQYASKIVFVEPTDGGATTYKKQFTIRALPLEVEDHKQQIQLIAKAGSARLVIGDKQIYELSHLRQLVEVDSKRATERILQAYHQRSLDRALESPAEPAIYIAKISLLQMGASYSIDHVQSLPFHDYVINPSMLHRIWNKQTDSRNNPYEDTTMSEAQQVMEKQQEQAAAASEFPPMEQEFARLFPDEVELEVDPLFATGTIDIPIVQEQPKKWYQRRQRKFYSEEIKHDLITDQPVLLTIALSDEQEQIDVPMPDMWRRSNAIFSSNGHLFDDSEFASNYPVVTFATVQYPKKGAFRVGVHVKHKTDRTFLRFRWWAVKVDQGELGKNEV